MDITTWKGIERCQRWPVSTEMEPYIRHFSIFQVYFLGLQPYKTLRMAPNTVAVQGLVSSAKQAHICEISIFPIKFLGVQH